MESSLLGVYSTKVEVEALKCASYEPRKQILSLYNTRKAILVVVELQKEFVQRNSVFPRSSNRTAAVAVPELREIKILDGTATVINRRVAYYQAYHLSAYYTTRAPFMPLRIGFLGVRPESTNDQRLRQLIKNIKAIEIDNCKAELAPHLNITTTWNISPNEHRANIQVVRLILRDLVNNLPLVIFSRNSSPRCIVSTTGPCLSLTRKQKEDIVPRTKSPVSSSSPTKTVNAAIQTWNIKSVSNGTDRCVWKGGVRALRNSLVRLMLRQMQHVNRLNKTLDHVQKTGQKFVY